MATESAELQLETVMVLDVTVAGQPDTGVVCAYICMPAVVVPAGTEMVVPVPTDPRPTTYQVMVEPPVLVAVAVPVAACPAHGGLGFEVMLRVAFCATVTVTELVAVVLPSFTVTE